MTTRRRSQGILRPLLILSSTRNTISKETDVVGVSVTANAEPASPTRYFPYSMKTHYKPSRQYYNDKKSHNKNGRDFRNHEDQERIHLEWMVRNIAEILGEDATPPGVGQVL